MTAVSRCSSSLPGLLIAEVQAEYRAALDVQTVRWSGELIPLKGLQVAHESPDRRTRERAWRLETARWQQDLPRFDELWRTLRTLLRESAAGAGMHDYADLRRYQLGYSPTPSGASQRARLAVEEFVTSVLVRLHERRRRQMGVRTLRPWDLAASLPGCRTDPVFATGGQLAEAVNATLLRVNHEFHGVQGRNLEGPESLVSDAEVEDRLAGYGAALAQSSTSGRRPEMKISEDVAGSAMQVLVLHGGAAARPALPLASNLARARMRHLERCLLRWTFGAMIDAYEAWSDKRSAQVEDDGAAAAMWAGLWLRFLPAVDWAGLDKELASEWQRHADLFLRPGESLLRVAAELHVYHTWITSTTISEWRQAPGVFGPPTTTQEPRYEIDEMDLLDVARWMEDTIEALEQVAA